MTKATTKCALPHAPQQCEKTFSASFVPQPAENTTS